MSLLNYIEERQIANENKADLFICIHCNSNPSKASYGTETYVMGLYKTQANLDGCTKGKFIYSFGRQLC